MRLHWRDKAATLLVVAAVLVYVLWVADAALPAFDSARTVSVAVLTLGFVACPLAGLRDFEEMVHRHRMYVTVMSWVGVAALAFAIIAMVTASHAMLAALVGTTVLLWMVSTARHLFRMPPAEDEFDREVRMLTEERRAHDRRRMSQH